MAMASAFTKLKLIRSRALISTANASTKRNWNLNSTDNYIHEKEIAEAYFPTLTERFILNPFRSVSYTLTDVIRSSTCSNNLSWGLNLSDRSRTTPSPALTFLKYPRLLSYRRWMVIETPGNLHIVRNTIGLNEEVKVWAKKFEDDIDQDFKVWIENGSFASDYVPVCPEVETKKVLAHRFERDDSGAYRMNPLFLKPNSSPLCPLKSHDTLLIFGLTTRWIGDWGEYPTVAHHSAELSVEVKGRKRHYLVRVGLPREYFKTNSIKVRKKCGFFLLTIPKKRPPRVPSLRFITEFKQEQQQQ